MPRLYSNIGGGTLLNPISAGAVSSTLNSGAGATLPNPAPGDFFDVALQQTAGGPVEFVRCTARSGDVLTHTPTANAYTAGAFVENRLPASALAEFEDVRELVRYGNPLVWNGNGGVDAGIYATGGISPGSDGTATARAQAQTNLFAGQRRIARVSATTAGSNAGWNGQALFARGSNPGNGGFLVITEFGISDAAPVADARNFIGLSQNSIGNVNPSTLLNIVGVGSDNGETTLSIMHNDGTGAATKIALGANFPCNTQNVDWYRFELWALPNAATINYRVTRRNTGNAAEGILSTDLPINTAYLFPILRRNNGATALAVSLDMSYTRMVPSL
jgi:hypothetical protein